MNLDKEKFLLKNSKDNQAKSLLSESKFSHSEQELKHNVDSVQ